MNEDASVKPLELDSLTYNLLEHLARTWGVSREDAVRRALEQADAIFR